LRVGIATIQGLAFARDLLVVPVSSLEALAVAARDFEPGGTLIAPWVDAARGEVFASLFSADAVEEVMPAVALAPGEAVDATLRIAGQRPIRFVGDGALRYRDVMRECVGSRATLCEPVPPLAPIAGRLAALYPERAVLPHAIVPIYVRRPDAEIARDRRSTTGR
jgi:tRNA threonylcarbamoyladenosine biosynthesis protein TsaB